MNSRARVAYRHLGVGVKFFEMLDGVVGGASEPLPLATFYSDSRKYQGNVSLFKSYKGRRPMGDVVAPCLAL